ncbi:unnamed protein product [Larinioides sclopetarius]|uniref:Condensin-2 complex subunit G2 n=2 Tax=Larinioides sclopetarius TaxID=280406 RepID=A0AAV1ZGZ0_9ARAC
MEDQISGKDLIAAVRDVQDGKLVEYASQNKSKKSSFKFKNVLKELSVDEIDNMWDVLSKTVINQVENIIGSNTKGSPNKSRDSPSKKVYQEVSHITQAAIDLAIVILEQRMPASQGLLHMVVFLNRIIFELPGSLDNLKNSIALLCEKMFHVNYLYQDHELITFNTLLYVIKRSLAVKPAKKDVKRIYALRSLFPKIISMQEEVDANEVFNIYKKCATSPLYLSMPEGQKIITIILTLDSDYVSQIHEAVKRYLPSATLAQGSAYGKAYFDAWSSSVKTNSEALQKELEICFQDLILMAVNGRRKSLVAALRKLLAQFNSQKKEPYVSKMLYNMYQPILWRFLKHPDGLIRANTAQLFLDVFPLEDPDVKIVAIDQELNDQMLLIKDLLLDDFPIVRSTAVIGLCIAMSINWELFPEDMLRTYFKIIVNDLSCDSSSADVRCAVAKGFKVLLENPLTLPTMQVILPRLKPLFHDISDPVRVAFCQLLLRVKKICAIKYFNVVPIEHLLARMEEDTVIAKLIVNLIHNSYFPKDEGPDGWLTRCVEMIKKDRGASRVFFQYVPSFIGLDATAQFMIRAVKGIHFYVRSKALAKDAATKESEKEFFNSLHDSMECMEEAVGFHDPDVVSGLLDAVAITWLSSLHNLEKPENKTLLKLIVAKLAKSLGDLSLYYKDTAVWESVYYLSSFMPSRNIPTLGSLCFLRLKDLDSTATPEDYMTLLQCLCNHNESSGLIGLFKEWIEKGFQQPADKPPAAKKRKSKKSIEPVEPKFDKHLLAVQLLNAVLDHRSCQKVVLTKHPELLKELLNFTDDLKRKVELSSENNICKEDEMFLTKLLYALLQISVLLHAEEKCNSVKFVEDVVLWIQDKLLRPACMEISLNTSAKRSRLQKNQQSAVFEKFTFDICKDVCQIITDMTLLGYMNPKSLKFLKFGMKLLSLGFGGKFLLPISKLLFNHISYGVYKTIEDDDSSILKFVPDSFNKIIQCLDDDDFLKAVPVTDSKEAQSLLAGALLLMQPHNSLKELVSSITTMVTKTILNSILNSVESWDDIEKKCNPFQLIPISKSGAFLLSMMCLKPKIMVYFLQQLQKYLLNSGRDIQSWVACYVIVVNLSEIKNNQ